MLVVITIHTTCSIIALIVGIDVLLRKKGSKLHKILGWIFCISMVLSSISSFWIRKFGEFSWIHILSILTLFWLFKAIYVVRKKPHNWMFFHILNMTNAFSGIIIASIGVIIRHFFLLGNVQAGVIGSIITAIVILPIRYQLIKKYNIN
jgi:uncharacterized membrane protein